jgi:putative SOS response-associated peptidase YedK
MAQSVGRKDSIQYPDEGRSPDRVRGLWEGWKPPKTEDWIRTCTIITGEPNELIREIHTRMPVILPEDKLDVWLSGEAGKEILAPYPSDLMSAYPISRRVNNPNIDDPGILESLPTALRVSEKCSRQILPVR